MLAILIVMCILYPFSIWGAIEYGKQVGYTDGTLDALIKHISTEYKKDQ